MLTSRRVLTPLLLMSLCVWAPHAAAAQSASSRRRIEVPTLPALERESAGRSLRIQPGSARDSLTDGTLIGAAIGAAALGGFAAIICKAQQEPEGPSCVSDTLRVAAIGAAIGAGAGLVVDAALLRQNGVSLSVGIRF